MPIVKISAINVALYLFICLNPYIKWLLPNELFYGFFILTTISLTFLIKKNVKNGIFINYQKKQIVFYLFIFIIYFTTPVFHDLRWGHMVWQIPFLLILFYDDIIITRGYFYFKKIMVWIAIFALIFWVLKLLHIPIPYFSYKPSFRYNPDDYYRIYGPVISLYSEDIAVGELRITGVFAEPGHYGIYLGLLLAIEKFNFKNIENKILLITGVLTFSTAFFGILVLGYIHHLIKERRITKNIILPFILIVVITVIAGDVIKELTYGRVLKDVDTKNNAIMSIVDSRISERFLTDFDDFSKTSKVFTGLGYFDQEDIPTTNWRGLIYRFGIIGLFIILLLIIFIIRRVDILYALLLFSIAILILSHRSYLLYTPSIYVLLFMATSVNLQQDISKNSIIV